MDQSEAAPLQGLKPRLHFKDFDVRAETSTLQTNHYRSQRRIAEMPGPC
jgi:hypothetical protein